MRSNVKFTRREEFKVTFTFSMYKCKIKKLNIKTIWELSLFIQIINHLVLTSLAIYAAEHLNFDCR